MASAPNFLATDDEEMHLICGESMEPLHSDGQRAVQRGAVEGVVQPASRGGGHRIALAVIGVGLLVGVVAVLWTRNGAASQIIEADAAVQFTETGVDAPSCTAGNQDWQVVSTSEFKVQNAIVKALHLAAIERLNCELASFSGFSDPQYYMHGSNHTHTVHVQHKFDAYCESESFKLNFHIAPKTTFRMQVNKDFSSGAWSLLNGASDPPICQLKLGCASSMESISPDSRFVQNSAEYAATELSYQMTKRNCLPPSGPYTCTKVLSAASQVLAGSSLTLKMELKSGTNIGVAILVVVEQCAKYDPCIRQLIIQDSNPCTPFVNQDRRLEDENSMGEIDEDPTGIWAEQRRLLTHPRELSSGVKPPLLVRYIKTGSVPSRYDPRGDTCSSKVTVYNQGVCGSCYAQAIAVMHGVRLCYIEKGGKPGGRRLDADRPQADFVDNDQIGEGVEDGQTLERQEGEQEEEREGITNENDEKEHGQDPNSKLRLTDANSDENSRRLSSLASCMGSEWSGWTCADSKDYCDSYPKLSTCCPKLCGGDLVSCMGSEWSGYTCADSKDYCDSYPKLSTCCPKLCSGDLASCMGSEWSGYTCADSKDYCDSYPKLSTCCPKLCGGGGLSTCMGSSSWKGHTCSNSKKYCGRYEKLRTCCPSLCSSSGCVDSSHWKYKRYPCSWFAKHDPGCTKYKDYGQRSHCKKTCNTCPGGKHGGASSSNPWYGAWYQYMPSVGQLAPCAKSASGTISGCSGGSLYSVWNNWMRKWSYNLYRMGQNCLPYTYKCWSSKGVVNPMSSGACSKYASYQEWHRPCSCIPANVKPTRYTCPSSPPATSCSVKAPTRMFMVKNMGHGLSNAETVLNMQRHIVEFGPIYVSFIVTQSFMRWPWSSKPVYTGGSGRKGGHAVVVSGWGTQGVDYWLMRNSWGARWADGGFCKFKRGVNLDNIESRSIGASMPTNNFKDWSGPVCTLRRWSLPYTYEGSTLYTLKLKLKISCSKKARLKIFISNRLTDKMAVYKGVRGIYMTGKMPDANKEEELPAVSMIPRGFGLSDGMSWIQIRATDTSGNTEKTSNFITINAISGMYRTRQN